MLVNLIKSRKTFIWLIIFLWFVVWAFSFINIPKENNPATDLPMFVVSTVLYWWDPVTIEKQISKKLEDEFKSINWIKKIESVSNFHFSVIIVNFQDGKNIIEAKSDLKDSIDKIYSSFPSWTLKPYAKQVSPDDTPIYSFSIVWDYLSKIIYKKSDWLEDKLKSVTWVSDVIIVWEPDKKINIFIDYDKLNKYSIDIWYVYNLLSNSFIKYPVDKKAINWSLYSYEISTYNKDIDDIIKRVKDTDIINIDSQSIKVENIADVYFEEVSLREKSYLSKDNNTSNAITFDIKVAPWSDVESVINDITEITNEFALKNKDLKVYETFSKLVEIRNTFETFVSNFRQTWIIIMIILFLFIWVRISIWVTITFPLVYLMTFIYLVFLWYTFNNVVSFALVLTLWIMVDNLIVITEWIVNEIKSWRKMSYWEAVRNTFKKFIWSIIPWTLITVFMFLPIFFMLSWTIWQFIWPLSITIAWTLLISLFVSIIILPIILWKTLPKDISKSSWILTKPLDKIWILISNISSILLKNKFFSSITVISFWIILFISFFLVWSWIIKTDFMPATDQDNIWINIKYPSWYSINENQVITKKILDDTNKFFKDNYDWYTEFISINIWNIYNTSPVSWAANTTADNQAYLNIKLIDWNSRDVKSYIIAEKLTNYIDKNIKPKYPMLSDIYTISWMSMSWWKAVWFYIIWDDYNKISAYIEKVLPRIKEIPWAFNFSTNLEYTNWRIKYLIDNNKALRNNVSILSMVSLFSSIKNSDYVPNWIPLNTFNEIGDDSIDLVMYTNYNNNVENIKLWKNFISKVTEERKIEAELKNIQHIDSKLQIIIEADKKSSVALWAITTEIDKIIEANPLPEGLSFRYNAAIEDQSQSSIDLGKALWTWIILMFMILVLKFNSFKYSTIVLTSTILSFIWVVWALLIMWLPLSFPAQLWLFWVIWVWVNNSILFIDAYLMKKRVNVKKDLIQTIRDRFTAIFLTTSTTIAWLTTLALKDELWWWLAIAFIWWLVLNVFIVMIYIPALLYTVEKPIEKAIKA